MIEGIGFLILSLALMVGMDRVFRKRRVRELMRFAGNDVALRGYELHRDSCVSTAPVRNVREWGIEEGKRCNRNGCPGTMVFRDVENPLTCDTCHEEVER